MKGPAGVLGVGLAVATALLALACREDAKPGGESASVPEVRIEIAECDDYMAQMRQQVSEAGSEKTRARIARAARAQQNALVRLANHPATRIGLSEYCRQLSWADERR